MSFDPDTIFKALRLVPEFDGNPNTLTRFIRLCDQLVGTYIRTDANAELNNLALLNGILNKITGNAARTINSNGIPENWIGIRTVLVNNFSDQRDETALYNDLSMQTQGTSSPQEFYDRCQTLFSTLMTYISLHENIPTTIEAKRNLYKKLTMQAFVRGLKEPLGSRIRCMRPDTIEKALEYVQEELNIMYLQQRNDGLSKTHNMPSTSSHKMHMPLMHATTNPPIIPRPFTLPPIPQSGNNWQRPMHFPSPPHFKPMIQPHQNQFRMPSRTQQMFRALPPNYNANNNAFRLPQRNFSNAPNMSNNVGPRPMSGVSNFVSKPLPPSGHDWRKFGNPPPSNYFKTRDVNFNDCITYPSDDYYNNYYQCYEPFYETDYGDYNEYVISDNDCNIATQCYDDSNLQYDNKYEEQPQPSSSSCNNEDFREVVTSKRSK